MSPETIDRIKEAIEPLADLAQQGAEFSWEVIVRQVVIEGVMNLVFAVILAALLPVMLVVAKRCYGKYRDANAERNHYGVGEGWIGGMIASLTVSALLFIGVLSAVQSGVPRLLNPGFYALKEVAQMVGAS